MSITLHNLIKTLGMAEHPQHLAYVRKLHAAGAFGVLPQAPESLTNKQAEALLNNVVFEKPEQAVDWLIKADPQQQPHREKIATALRVKESMNTLLLIKPEDIQSDPARFQFRDYANAASGVEEKDKIQQPYHPLVHGQPLLVWQDKAGKSFVVDGHHRLEYFKRLRAANEGPETVPVRMLKEADGITAEDAKIIGAFVNFATDKTPDVKKAAEVFHEVLHGNVHKEHLPELSLDGPLAPAYYAAKLAPEAFSAVKDGSVPVDAAAVIAQQVPDPKVQIASIQAVKMSLANAGRSYVRA